MPIADTVDFPSDDTRALDGQIRAMKPGVGEVEILGQRIAAKNIQDLSGHYETPRLEKGFLKSRVVMTIRDNNSKLKSVTINCKDIAKRMGVNQSEVEKAVRGQQPFESWIRERLEARASALSNLAEAGLKQSEYETICHYYSSHKEELESHTQPVHIRKGFRNKLPRSIVYNPSPPNKGLHILCKTHGGAEEIGFGSFNRATLILHVDSGDLKIFRNCVVKSSEEDRELLRQELAANKAYMEIDPDSEYFTCGVPVAYTGPWRPRAKAHDREVGMTKKERDKVAPRERGPLKGGYHNKLGLIMDYAPDGSLADRVYDPRYPAWPQRNKVATCIHIAKGLRKAHRAGLVNFDNKPENIFMRGNTPIQGDFGMVHHKGDLVQTGKGTPGYISPEMMALHASPDMAFTARPANEMWIMGCILATVIKGEEFIDWTSQDSDEIDLLLRVMDKRQLQEALDRYFPEHENKDHIDYAIVQCLQFRPDDRIRAKDLVPLLERIHRNLT